MLATTRTVILDEIHAVAPNKRGAHLALSLERLSALCGDGLQRIGLSATQNPIRESRTSWSARRKVATRRRTSRSSIPDTSARAISPSRPRSRRSKRSCRTRSGARSTSGSRDLIRAHKTTLVFVNTRRMSERVARELADRLGGDAVATHHGSMAKEKRLAAEQRLKAGDLKAMIATASLELGIDIGDVELVCQLGSPRSIATFLQRVGRSGHAIDGTPKGRLFPLSRDDLIECAALLDSVRRGELDRLTIPVRAPRRARPADRRRGRGAGLGGDRAFRPPAARLALPRLWSAKPSTPSSASSPRASPPASAGAGRSSIATPSTGSCAAGEARGRPR